MTGLSRQFSMSCQSYLAVATAGFFFCGEQKEKIAHTNTSIFIYNKDNLKYIITRGVCPLTGAQECVIWKVSHTYSIKVDVGVW